MRLFTAVAGAAAIFALSGCGDSNNDPVPEETFTLQLLHLADVDGGGTAAMFNVDEFSALVEHFRKEMPNNTVVASSGDNYIPGPIFTASKDERMNAVVGVAGEGRGETQIQNKLGIQVSAVGNHDLDTGPSGFAGIISPDGEYPGAGYPYISANVDFSADDNTKDLVVAGGQEASGIAGKIAPSTVITVNGERIGFVGAVTPTLPQITSTGSLDISPANFTNDATGLQALADAIQPEIDALVGDGINKIVLLSHMQDLDVERALAPLLDGVDIIVGGGSNSLLADSDDLIRDGDTVADTYPISLQTSSGEPVLLVNTEADYKYLGRLVVDFDEQGLVLIDSIDPAESGAWAAATEIVDDLLMAEPIDGVVEVAGVIRTILGELDGSAFGITEVFLDGRRAFVRSRETNLGNLSADANLWYGQQMVDANPPIVSVKNGGGIRAPIGRVVSPAGSTSAEDLQLLPPAANDFGKPEGGISQLDIQTSLAFNNGLALVTMTAAELHDLVEKMITGNFTHTAGLRLEFDPDGQARTGDDTNQGSSGVTNGERVRKLEVLVDPDAADEIDRYDLIVENGILQGDPTRSFRVITLSFLATACVTDVKIECGSGWPFKGLVDPEYVLLDDGQFDTRDPGNTDFSVTGAEQDALSEFLQQFHPDAASAYDVPFNVNERLIPLETAQ